MPPYVRAKRGPNRLAVTMAASSLFFAIPSRAADASDGTDALVEHALDLREQGRDAEALDELRRAETIAPSPRVHAQVALAEQALGRWVEAEAGLTEALAAQDPWIDRSRAVLEGALVTVQAHLGWLEVEANVPATLVIDGAARFPLPLERPVRVVAGVVIVTVLAPGYEDALRRVDIGPRAHAHERLTLVPRRTPVDADTVPSPRASRPPPTEAWVTLGVASALAGGAIFAAVVQANNAAIYNNNDRCQAIAGKTRDEQCGSYASTANTAEALAKGGAAAAAGTGALSLYYFLRDRAQAPTRASRVPECQLGVLTITCAGRF